MIIRETVLMPGLQYILKLAEGELTRDSIVELKRFSEYQNLEDVKKIIWNIADLLEIYLTDQEEARKKLELLIDTPYACNQCMKCCQCQQYFLIELYQSLFSGNRFEDTKERIRRDNHYVMRRLPKNLYGDLDSRVMASEYYWERCKSLRKRRTFENQMVILKGMSSSTPAVLNGAFNTHSFHGGGIYFNWYGFGIVIDPGYHFVDNMHQFGLTVLDINAVVITHEHIDHTNDIRVLDDLNYSLYRYRKKENGHSKHKIHWYFDQVTYQLAKTLQESGSGFSDAANVIFEIRQESQELFHEETDDGKNRKSFIEDYSRNGIVIHSDKSSKIVLRAVRTFHEKNKGTDSTKASVDKYLKHTFAASFELEKGLERRKIFYSSDTMYQDTIGEAAKGSDVVIANVSSVYEDDLMRVNLKKTHLGYMGCYKLLNALKEHPPAYFLLSEFWNAKRDIRFDIAKFLKDEIMAGGEDEELKGIRIIPADVGLQLDIGSLRVRCGMCGEKAEDFIVIRPRSDCDEIRCVCRQCFY